jgi:hypothetical protein
MVKNANFQIQDKTTKVKDLSIEDLKTLIRQTVQETIGDMLDDPEDNAEFKPEFVRETQESLNYVKQGGKTTSLKEFIKEHGLKA